MRLMLKGTSQIFEEIALQYKRFIEAGVYHEGDKLPSCRALALELGINPATVERAYSLLEQDGYVVILPKKGAFVAMRFLQTPKDLEDAILFNLKELKAKGVKKEALYHYIEELFLGDEE